MDAAQEKWVHDWAELLKSGSLFKLHEVFVSPMIASELEMTAYGEEQAKAIHKMTVVEIKAMIQASGEQVQLGSKPNLTKQLLAIQGAKHKCELETSRNTAEKVSVFLKLMQAIKEDSIRASMNDTPQSIENKLASRSAVNSSLSAAFGAVVSKKRSLSEMLQSLTPNQFIPFPKEVAQPQSIQPHDLLELVTAQATQMLNKEWEGLRDSYLEEQLIKVGSSKQDGEVCVVNRLFGTYPPNRDFRLVVSGHVCAIPGAEPKSSKNCVPAGTIIVGNETFTIRINQPKDRICGSYINKPAWMVRTFIDKSGTSEDASPSSKQDPDTEAADTGRKSIWFPTLVAQHVEVDIQPRQPQEEETTVESPQPGQPENSEPAAKKPKSARKQPKQNDDSPGKEPASTEPFNYQLVITYLQPNPILYDSEELFNTLNLYKGGDDEDDCDRIVFEWTRPQFECEIGKQTQKISPLVRRN